MFRVRTPEPGHVGEVGGVVFVDGEAVVDHGPALAYFRSAGYHITSIDEPTAAEPTESAVPVDPAEPVDVDGPAAESSQPGGERPRDNASTETWRAYAIDHGMTPEEVENLSRDDLVARYPKENG